MENKISVSMDGDLGNSFKHLVCPECKEKLLKAGSKLSKFDMIRPKKLVLKFQSLICEDCKKKVIKSMKDKGMVGVEK